MISLVYESSNIISFIKLMQEIFSAFAIIKLLILFEKHVF